MTQYLQNEQNTEYNGTELLFDTEKALTKYNQWIVSMFTKYTTPATKKVLDFGGGIGSLSKLFYKNTNIKPEIVELDKNSRQHLSELGFDNFKSIPNDKYYNLIFSSNVLEHIEEDTKQLEILNHHLETDGLLALYLPALSLLWTDLDNNVGHYRRYNKKDLIHKVQMAGFKVVNVKYCDSAGGLLTLLFKIMNKKSNTISTKNLYMYDKYIFPWNVLLDKICGTFFGKNIFLVAQKK